MLVRVRAGFTRSAKERVEVASPHGNEYDVRAEWTKFSTSEARCALWLPRAEQRR